MVTTRSSEEDDIVGVCVEHGGNDSDIREMSREEVRFRESAVQRSALTIRPPVGSWT